jgi:NADH dehydrogenase
MYRRRGIQFVQEEIIEVLSRENAIVTHARKIPFDYLVLAFGGVSNFYGVEGAEQNLLALKTFEDTLRIKEELRVALHKASYYHDPIKIIVCGGGVTGVEAATEIVEIAGKKANVIVCDSGKAVMKGFPSKAVKYVQNVLAVKGIKFLGNARIKKSLPGKLIFADGKEIYASVIVWCGGVKPNPVAQRAAMRTSERGAVMVNEYLQTSYHNIYAVGDCSYSYKDPVPTTAQSAIKQAKIAAHNILADIAKTDKKIFYAKANPYIISLGKGRAVLQNGQKVRSGILYAIIKTFIEKHYIFTRKHWRWPFNRLVFE